MINNCKIISNILIAKDTFEMEISFPNTKRIKPGQFINIKVPGFSLRRPISISSVEESSIKIIYKILGKGTLEMSKFEAGMMIDILGPLGNPFTIHEDEDEILIIGGGVGVPPLYEVAKIYKDLNKKVTVALGFNNSSSIFLEKAFEELGCIVFVSTMDGSNGYKGHVMQLVEEYNLHGFVYACGPEIMLKTVEDKFDNGYVSYESRMACGIGTCMGCVCKDKKDPQKYYRICKEGPVFEIGVVE
ncbi:dihydroorotate dehydrogenase electron transfer subunit [Helcococcus kunzii]|uniref:dihydroorotate dehydrogenase electron transfer subunit n=1 Tax=Helcococcus kunzii TaxID=40091 RepID=UPI001BAE65F8|nr:dihydroorotate dehydrogenase electron transfer subunit [Helcococcus kunzii]MCT1796761.1 dihydroorotate dehydrogenase electron transfer subunit [Helcococcus kunzii]MCT1988851.1 dihydroorotate dehydrogenase electron transfer subunit [Helcococcus kunzii]QUY64497.1 dihydroorotate dehydrogenase electron transfer subunit [Helcococcus kunzii]QZO76909.1 dihydroorotate dehydrogenase electron transfer subunit [Helcococcus kunzii]